MCVYLCAHLSSRQETNKLSLPHLLLPSFLSTTHSLLPLISHPSSLTWQVAYRTVGCHCGHRTTIDSSRGAGGRRRSHRSHRARWGWVGQGVCPVLRLPSTCACVRVAYLGSVCARCRCRYCCRRCPQPEYAAHTAQQIGHGWQGHTPPSLTTPTPTATGRTTATAAGSACSTCRITEVRTVSHQRIYLRRVRRKHPVEISIFAFLLLLLLIATATATTTATVRLR